MRTPTGSSGSHPAGGVTGMPGRNAARELLRDRGWRVSKRGLVSLVRGYWKLWQSFQRFRKMTQRQAPPQDRQERSYTRPSGRRAIGAWWTVVNWPPSS
ncbi:MAG: hypothetical protein ABFD96_11530 [Armatimonadia bacterium]